MKLLESHVVLMFIYAVATAVFFAFLWKSTTRERIRFFIVVFACLFLGGLALAWMMFPLPLDK